jgi:hypothetical protein
MVWHAMLPKNVNLTFYKKWRYAKTVKMIGPLYVQVLDENDRKKPYIIHVNRVVMTTSQQIRENCDSILSRYEDDIQTSDQPKPEFSTLAETEYSADCRYQIFSFG